MAAEMKNSFEELENNIEESPKTIEYKTNKWKTGKSED